jgi:hypothetical protein
MFSVATPQNTTDKLVPIFLHDAVGCSESWKEFPIQLGKKKKWKQRGFCMTD